MKSWAVREYSSSTSPVVNKTFIVLRRVSTSKTKPSLCFLQVSKSQQRTRIRSPGCIESLDLIIGMPGRRVRRTDHPIPQSAVFIRVNIGYKSPLAGTVEALIEFLNPYEVAYLHYCFSSIGFKGVTPGGTSPLTIPPCLTMTRVTTVAGT